MSKNNNEISNYKDPRIYFFNWDYYTTSMKLMKEDESIPEPCEGTTTSRVMQSPGCTTWVKAQTKAVLGISLEALTATTTFTGTSEPPFSWFPLFCSLLITTTTKSIYQKPPLVLLTKVPITFIATTKACLQGALRHFMHYYTVPSMLDSKDKNRQNTSRYSSNTPSLTRPFSLLNTSSSRTNDKNQFHSL